MSCAIDSTTLDKLIEFHGHSCPGLSIGVRAAELALRELGEPDAQDLLIVTETDMCAVDALQFLTGCTFGKGNLIHRDYGKTAFSFYDRKSGRAIRLRFRPEARGPQSEEMSSLMSRSAKDELSQEERDRLSLLRKAVQERLMTLELTEMFDVEPISSPPPRPAKVLQTLVCHACGEGVMESRTRRFDGQELCIPCFELVEQKV